MCTGTEISGPGFINLTFDGTWIEELLNAQASQPQGGPETPTRSASSSTIPRPNVAKEMHVGHLRTTVVGDSLSASSKRWATR